MRSPFSASFAMLRSHHMRHPTPGPYFEASMNVQSSQRSERSNAPTLHKFINERQKGHGSGV